MYLFLIVIVIVVMIALLRINNLPEDKSTGPKKFTWQQQSADWWYISSDGPGSDNGYGSDGGGSFDGGGSDGGGSFDGGGSDGGGDSASSF